MRSKRFYPAPGYPRPVDVASLAFFDANRPDRSGTLALEEGRLVLRASPALGRALNDALGDSAADVAPLAFNDRALGLALASALAKGTAANLVECEFVVGAFEVRAFLGRRWARITLAPGNFDPDAAWNLLLAVNEAKLATPRA